MISIIILTTFLAAFVNGGLGYGFSSITVPVALLYYSNRVLNPALVLVELGVNGFILISHRRRVPHIWRRVAPILIGLVPAIAIFSALLNTVDASQIRLVTYLFLAGVIVLQGFGFRRPIRTEGTRGVAFGGFIGMLYALTTISGPPLVIALNNEGLEKEDFKAALGLIRIFESGFTALAYYHLGFFSTESASLLLWILPGVALGMPLGASALGRFEPAVFRRICITVDSWLISFGLFRALGAVPGLGNVEISLVCAAIVVLDGVNLARFLKTPVTPTIRLPVGRRPEVPHSKSA